MKNNNRYMTDQEYNDLVNECRKDAYEYTMDELESQIDTGYDCRSDFRCDGDYKMVHRCDVVLGIYEEIFKERTQVIIRNKKIATIISDEQEDEWWII
ncbi:hypothetical protein ACFS7Z_08650 [Pontibacter toksunensis]|uniref:Uncharacterized protein n=1 Tax=Pontibacter toksunensis TaxID=1332631 RepID=A0ABW6BRP4_9BACT